MSMIFDPRYNNLVIGVTHQRAGNLPGSNELTLRVTNGEGQVWLDPGVTPTLGMFEEGTLVVASETFPRYAPLTLHLTGADLVFHVRQRRVLSFALFARGESIARLYCGGLWSAPYRCLLRWPGLGSQLLLTRSNAADQDRETTLALDVFKGAITGREGDDRIDSASGYLVINDRIVVQRETDGELGLRFHAARMEWVFQNGVLRALRLFDSQGAIANLRLLDLSLAGVAITVGLMDTLS